MKTSRSLILGEVVYKYINHLWYCIFFTSFIEWLRFLVLITSLVKTENQTLPCVAFRLQVVTEPINYKFLSP